MPLKRVADIRLKVFTIAFRKVNDITYPNQGPWEVDVPVPLTDKWGTPLANGVYYVLVVSNVGGWKSKLLILR